MKRDPTTTRKGLRERAEAVSSVFHQTRGFGLSSQKNKQTLMSFLLVNSRKETRSKVGVNKKRGKQNQQNDEVLATKM